MRRSKARWELLKLSLSSQSMQDLPEGYGPWPTVASRFYRWRKKGLWEGLLSNLQQEADAAGQLEWEVHYVDGTIVRAHQHAAGAKKGAETRH